MSTPQNEIEADESSGVTALRPVPSKPARLFELSESDSTHYFSATELLERGKALAASQATEASAQPTPEPAEAPEAAAQSPGALAQFRRASLPRKALAVLLPLACALLLAKPLLKKPTPSTVSKPIASPSASIVPKTPERAPAAASAALTSISLPRGVSAAHAAADSVAMGDFSRALALYRELSQREPKNAAYREAARILSERARTRSP
ncbi:MAG TPA: hypothetical protein VER11_22830 [Polyangiaceae bacterium]|nr:hypothetical protein [Polyangiaceae bacterium]